ncbi:MAG TPA: DUF6629 family protein [Acidimicrobiales bacterium]|nr:DUF6629 family protein [Acidimicrobiales bacterium]
MCFSAEADLVAGAVVTAVGVDALRQAREPAERALATLPLLLGAHLLVEAVVWWGLTDQVDRSTGRVAMYLYLAFALCVLPLLVPLTIRGMDPDPRRRRLMSSLAAAGAIVAAVYLVGLAKGPTSVRIDGRHLAYDVQVAHGGLLAAVYAVVACAPLLLSSHRRIVEFGVANVLAVAALTWLQTTALTSLWCAWAAVTSLAIATYLRERHPDREAKAHPA